MTNEYNFVDAIARELGAAPAPEKVLPGKIIRFSTNGKRGDCAGWCKLFPDGRGGVFGDWRTGEHHNWRANLPEPFNRRQARAEIVAAQVARIEEEAQRHARTAEDARRIWTEAPSCDQHPYLQRKRVTEDGQRVQFAHAGECRGKFFTALADGQRMPLRGLLLLVPLRDIEWRLWSLQAIDAAGGKAFMRGGRKRGLFHLVRREVLRGATADFTGDIGICEGLATALTVSKESHWPVFVAFDAGNLLPVALQVRAKFPKARVVVAGDCDRSGVGQQKAEAAAAAIHGYVSIPPLTQDDLSKGLSDWNDYASANEETTT